MDQVVSLCKQLIFGSSGSIKADLRYF